MLVRLRPVCPRLASRVPRLASPGWVSGTCLVTWASVDGRLGGVLRARGTRQRRSVGATGCAAAADVSALRDRALRVVTYTI